MKAGSLVTIYITDKQRGKRPGHTGQGALEPLVVQLKETFNKLLLGYCLIIVFPLKNA